MKLNLGSGPHKLHGFLNLDPAIDGWTFESGLTYPEASVEAITVSHALMYVEVAWWPFVFGEITRVLQPGGVVRITEDATDDERSPRFGGFHDAVTLTTYRNVAVALRAAGLHPAWMPPDGSMFKDNSLQQSWHGAPPKVFFIEGIKP